MSSAVPDASARRYGRISAIGALVLVLIAALLWFEPAWSTRLRSAWLDGYQVVTPREVQSLPALVVEIDDKSLELVGQWPWPRTVLADLVREIARHDPLAIGLDILMPEPDHQSPERVLERARQQDPVLADRLSGLPSNDDALARAIAEAPVVLAVAGRLDATGGVLRMPPFTVTDPTLSRGATPAMPDVFRFEGALTSIDALDRAAKGHGVISVGPSTEVLRRLPLVTSINGTLAPSFPMEMLRVAVKAPSLRLLVHGPQVDAIAIKDFVAETEHDGAVSIYYSHRLGQRFVSASDVLAGIVDPARIEHKLVLIGTTGIGLVDYQNTPLDERMPGSEIQAQVLENMYDQSLLRRPSWAHLLEVALFIVFGGLLVWATPRWKPRNATLLALAAALGVVAAAYAAFRWKHMLFDAATPVLGSLFLFSVLLVLTLAEATRQRRSLERVVAVQREEAAYIAGELRAAQRIQTGILPRADQFEADRRIDLAALMVPAREVGGDLYDFFRLDPRRLFFLIGDVAGKGLSASMFMAVSKALYKSAALKTGEQDVGRLMMTANGEVSRDNSEMFFVTALAGVLDLDTGALAYCNAGHENPYVVPAVGGNPVRLEGGAGPPLCTVDDFPYREAVYRMRPGEAICLVTDGVTEAQNAAGALYGRPRLDALLSRLRGETLSADHVVDAIRADVDAFVTGAEQSDDLTILVLRWCGPAADTQ